MAKEIRKDGRQARTNHDQCDHKLAIARGSGLPLAYFSTQCLQRFHRRRVSPLRVKDVLGTPPESGQTLASACFTTGSAPGGVVADCFGREFMPQTPDRYYGDSNLISLSRRATPISLSVEFLNKEGGVVESRQIRVDSFPVIPWRSRTIGIEREFFSFCDQGIFFSTHGGGWGSRMGYGVRVWCRKKKKKKKKKRQPAVILKVSSQWRLPAAIYGGLVKATVGEQSAKRFSRRASRWRRSNQCGTAC